MKFQLVENVNTSNREYTTIIVHILQKLGFDCDIFHDPSIVIHHVNNNHYDNRLSNIAFMSDSNHRGYSNHVRSLDTEPELEYEWEDDLERFAGRVGIDYVLLKDIIGD